MTYRRTRRGARESQEGTEGGRKKKEEEEEQEAGGGREGGGAPEKSGTTEGQRDSRHEARLARAARRKILH
jgi:hypothetical protein